MPPRPWWWWIVALTERMDAFAERLEVKAEAMRARTRAKVAAVRQAAEEPSEYKKALVDLVLMQERVARTEAAARRREMREEAAFWVKLGVCP